LADRSSESLIVGTDGMIRKSGLASLALAILASAGLAGSNDYVFEPVKAEIKASNVAKIAVRLAHKPGGKAVPNALIESARLTMPHEGTAEMTSAIAPLPSSEPGVYEFMAPMMMAGRWLLRLTARVEGEPEPVTGTITFRVKH
jgi:YtkA-like